MTDGWKLTALVLVALVAAGCQEQLSPQAQQLLRSGYQAYDARENAEAVAQMDRFLAENGRSSRVDEAYYLRGLAKRRLDERDGARGDLQAAVAATRNPQIRANALIAMGDMAFEDGEVSVAEDLFRRSLEDLPPDQPPADHAHFRLGSILQRQGQWGQADVQFDRVVHQFPDTALAHLAGRRTHSTAWTIQLGAFRDRTGARAVAEAAGPQPAETRAVLEDGKPLFLVQIGRYVTYAEAEQALSAVRARHSEAFVVPTP